MLAAAEPVYHVVHIVNPGKFFVRNSKEQEKYETLTKTLQKMELKPRKEEQRFDALTKALQNMQLHPVRSSIAEAPKYGAVKRHGSVHRCRIMEYKDKYAEVQLLDTGEIVVVAKDCVYQLLEKYEKTPPPLATECCFLDLQPYSKDIGWTETSRKIFADEVRHKHFSLRVFDSSELPWKVDLLHGHDKVSVRDHLIHTKCGVFPNPKKLKPRKSLEKPVHLDPAKNHRVVVTWVEDPEEISMIEGQNFSILQALEKRLQQSYSKADIPQWNSSMGYLLIANIDGRFHRAKLLNSLTDDFHEVEMIDWGRVKFLKSSQMLEAKDDFFKEPPLSHKFALNNVKASSPKYGWSAECLKSLRKICEGKKGIIHLNDERNVKLTVDEICINDWVVTRKYGRWIDEKHI